MFVWSFIFLLGVLVSKEGSVLTIGEETYSLQQFYAHYPKKQWANADSSKRDKIYTEFIKRELCILEAKRLSLDADPDVAVKIRSRSNQLLVNESYEKLVAFPLIDQDYIADARMFARQEVFVNHILIGYSGAYLARPPERSADDALSLAQNIKIEFDDGADFSALAKKYSEDPSASFNAGAVGWVSWGATVPDFQSAAFRLEHNLLSDPVLTPFGYHLILVTDSRLSDYQYLSEVEYESAIMTLSKGAVRGDRLRGAAIVYDSLQIEEYGVYFNADAILKIEQAYPFKQKDSAYKNAGKLNTADFLESISGVGVVCVYGGRGFGSRWFANKIGRLPPTRQPLLDSEDIIMSVFRTIILQDIAIKNSYMLGIDVSSSFIRRKRALVSGLLYDAYLKHLVNSVPQPDSADVHKHYNENMVEKYLEPGTVLIREIRVVARGLADSLLGLVSSGADFGLLAKEYSLLNPAGGGLRGPFLRNKNRVLFDAAIVLGPGETSPVLSVDNGQFSIVLLEENTPGKPIGLFRVYSRIESLLIKESQGAAKRGGIDGLLDKYSVHRHFEPLGR